MQPQKDNHPIYATGVGISTSLIANKTSNVLSFITVIWLGIGKCEIRGNGPNLDFSMEVILFDSKIFNVFSI